MNVINFHVTNSCNYRCAYCFGKFPNKDELPFERACKIIDNIALYFSRAGITGSRINLAGGEPLLYSYLDELIDYISAYGIKVSIITNGSLLTEERIAAWKDKVYCIGLSIDSASDDTNLSIGRCYNDNALSVKRAINIASAIHRNGIRLKINTVVSKFNINEDLTKLYQRLNPGKLKLLQVELIEGINDNARDLAITDKEFNAFFTRHKHCCPKTVCESSSNLENSYLMINPLGQFQLNDSGRYEIYGNCLEEQLDVILSRAPIRIDKFNSRYENNGSQNINKEFYIFGGHATWIKEIKKRLKNARFFKGGDLRSLDVIRNADEIWIQPNAISHSFFGKVLDAARTNGIPVHYFSYAGTKKCLEQLYLEALS